MRQKWPGGNREEFFPRKKIKVYRSETECPSPRECCMTHRSISTSGCSAQQIPGSNNWSRSRAPSDNVYRVIRSAPGAISCDIIVLLLRTSDSHSSQGRLFLFLVFRRRSAKMGEFQGRSVSGAKSDASDKKISLTTCLSFLRDPQTGWDSFCDGRR